VIQVFKLSYIFSSDEYLCGNLSDCKWQENNCTNW
jgi:hypothetical protein